MNEATAVVLSMYSLSFLCVSLYHLSLYPATPVPLFKLHKWPLSLYTKTTRFAGYKGSWLLSFRGIFLLYASVCAVEENLLTIA